MELPVLLQNKIIDFLKSLPNLDDTKSRQAFIYSAGLDSGLKGQIPFDLPPSQFIPFLISIPLKYGRLNDGRHALEAILEASKEYVGQDKQKYCDTLIQELQEHVKSIKTDTASVTSKYKKIHTIGQQPEPRSIGPLRIFLSYGHDSNEELVLRIKADLEKRGHDVWGDKSEIKFGDDWRRAITDGIVGSNRVLSFLSRHSTHDPGVCLDEIAIAIGVKGGNIQTILVENETEVKPPASISHIQWLDMHDWKEWRTAGQAMWEEWYQAKLAEIVQVVESAENCRFAGEIETLKGCLKPISSDSRIATLLGKNFVGRSWLVDVIEEWRNAPKHASRLFWITGPPGVGKSAFAAQLTHMRGDTVIAAQFCEWNKPDHRNPRRVICSLAFQLATRLPHYRKLLLALPEITELDRKDAAELFDYLLANPLRLIINDSRERYLIVIDALDETGEGGRNPLVEMLAQNASRLPEWLGLVVTSRPEFDVKTPLQALSPFPLDTKSESNRTDICDYLQHALLSTLQSRPDADCIVDQILEKSEGVFLYVERFCDDVHRGQISLDHPKQFPQSLGGMFAQYFNRQFPDLEKFRKDVRPALRAVLAAREPLPVEILQRLFNWQDEELRDFTRPFSSLFPITTEADHEVIKPYHKSLADWLADEKKAGAYYVSVKEGNRMLADYGRGWWSRDRYALAYLPSHLACCQDWTALSSLLINAEFIRTKRMQLGYALLAKDYEMVREDNLLPVFSESELNLFRCVTNAVEELTRFSGRNAETLQVEDLLHLSHPQHVVITGIPAIGKTWFLTHLWLGDIDRRVLIRLPLPGIGSFLEVERYICDSASEYFDISARADSGSNDHKTVSLRRLSEHFPEGTCLIIDEMDFVRTSWNDESHNFPLTKCRFIWGMRPEPEFPQFLEFLGGDTHLTILSTLSHAELIAYVRHELAQLLQGRSDADALIDELLSKSEGNLYCLSFFCDQLKTGHITLDLFAETPQALLVSGRFHQYFKIRFPDVAKFNENIRPALSAILAARGSLPVKDLQELLEWREEDMREFTHAVGPLFSVIDEGGNEVIRPFHNSLYNWLTEQNPATLCPMAGPYSIDFEMGERMLEGLEIEDEQSPATP